MRLLLDEMYSVSHAEAFRDASIDAPTVADLGLAGCSDLDLFAAAAADGYALLSQNVADVTRISADHLAAGRHHPGIFIALSSRFSRRPAGRSSLVAAVLAIADQPLEDPRRLSRAHRPIRNSPQVRKSCSRRPSVIW